MVILLLGLMAEETEAQNARRLACQWRGDQDFSDSRLAPVTILHGADMLFWVPQLLPVLPPLFPGVPGHNGRRRGSRLISPGQISGVTFRGTSDVPDSLAISKRCDFLKSSEQL